MNKFKIFIIIFLLLCLVFTFTRMDRTIETTVTITLPQPIANTIEENKNTVVEIENIITEEEQEEEEEIIIPETYITMYATVGLNIRQEADINSQIIDTVDINTELQIVDNSDNDEWTQIKIDDNYYYVASRFLSTEKVEIVKSIVNNNNNTGVLTKSKGVNYFNGHRETWYSQRVLLGGGLRIPGRHVDERGLVCDGDGYICVASNDYSKGTIVETSLGTGKVYDSGCPSGTIDIYCDW